LKADGLIRALVVDDELHARDELSALLEETGAFSIAGSCANAIEALQAIRKARPDAVFLDIQMPVINGFELLSMIDGRDMPAIVFVTAYDEYAIKAFEENALDYLLKPVEKERLEKTVERLKQRLARDRGPAPDGFWREKHQPAYPFAEITRIPCVAGNRIKLASTAEVEFVRSDFTGVYVTGPKGELFTELTLRVIEARTHLVRCHRQYLVNIDCVDEILLCNNMLAQMQTKSGRSVPVSRRYLKKIREKLGI
jgi:two-component system LytT family response regulator